MSRWSWHRLGVSAGLATAGLGAAAVTPIGASPAAAATTLNSYLFINENSAATSDGNNEVLSYRVSALGSSTLIGRYDTGHAAGNTSYLASEREDLAKASNHLYALNLGDQTLSVFTINAGSGALTPQSAATIALHATSIAISPDGKVLYAGGAANETSLPQLAAYAINPDGTISPTAFSVQPNVQIDGLSVAPNGTEIAAAEPGSGNAPNGGMVQIWPLGADGSIQADSTSAATCPTDVRFSPDSSSVYSAACSAGALSAFSDGVLPLTFKGSSPTYSQTLAVGPDGIVYFDTPNGLQGALINNGTFALGPRTVYPGENGSNAVISSMVVSRDGSQLFVAGYNTRSVNDYTIDPSTRALTLAVQVPVLPGLASVVSVAVACPGDPDPSGATCVDSQNAQVSVDPGSLTVTTPYTANNPYQMPALHLNGSATLLTDTSQFPDAGDPMIRVHSSLAGDPNWTVTVTDTDLACQAGACTNPVIGDYQTINGENIGLTGGTSSVPLPSSQFPGTVGFTDIAAASGVAPSDPGSQGLKNGPHTFAHSAGGGNGYVDIYGQLTVNAPTATQAGTYTGTLTFTVG